MKKNGRTVTTCPISTKERSDDEAPNDWRWIKLDSVARLESGHTPSRKIPEYWDGGEIPWLSLKDIRGLSDAYVTDTVDTPTLEGINNSSARLLPKDTVAFCRTASVGNVAILGREMATSQDFVNWVCSDSIEPKYLYWALKSSGHEFDKEKQGATHKTIYMPTVKRFQVLLPPLSEQKRIADILDKADAIRRKRQQAIEEAKGIPSAIFNNWFGDKSKYPPQRLRGFATKISSGSTPRGGSSVYLDDGPVMLVRSQNVLMNSLDLSDVAFISNEIDAGMKRSILSKNDVLLNITGASIGRVSRFNLEGIRANVNQHVCIIRCKPDCLNPVFLEYFLSTPQMQNDINNRHQHGGTRQALTFAQISEFPIPVPPIEQQERFASCVESYLKSAKSLDTAECESNNLFNSLVQRAFKGEL